MTDRAHEGAPSLPYMIVLIIVVTAYSCCIQLLLGDIEQPTRDKLLSQQVFVLLAGIITAVALPPFLWSLKTRLVAARGSFVKIARKTTEFVKKSNALAYKILCALIFIFGAKAALKELWSFLSAL